MKKSFALGAVSGISALAIGFPLAAQFAGAQSGTDSQTTPTMKDRIAFHGERAPLSQDDVQDMIDRDNAILLNIDAFVAIQKEAVQNHRIALEAAADMEDETERNDAVEAAHEAMHEEIRTAIDANPDLKNAMPFGPMGPRGKGPRGRHGMMDMRFDLEEKLGMSHEEIKTELDAGKTIEEIAAEKGVELPERPMFRGQHPDDDMDDDNEVQD